MPSLDYTVGLIYLPGVQSSDTGEAGCKLEGAQAPFMTKTGRPNSARPHRCQIELHNRPRRVASRQVRRSRSFLTRLLPVTISMPHFLDPRPPDGPRTEKRKSHELEQREVSGNKRQATSTTLPSASGSGTLYWMVQWYVSPDACFRHNETWKLKGEHPNRKNTRLGRGMVCLS
jgi:hypothetical protein